MTLRSSEKSEAVAPKTSLNAVSKALTTWQIHAPSLNHLFEGEFTLNARLNFHGQIQQVFRALDGPGHRVVALGLESQQNLPFRLLVSVLMVCHVHASCFPHEGALGFTPTGPVMTLQERPEAIWGR